MVHMWNIPPEYMCPQHRRGEHFEMHKIVKCIESERINKVKGHAENDQIDTSLISERHAELEEFCGWDSPIDYDDELNLGKVYPEESIRILMYKCDDCYKIMKGHKNEIMERYGVKV